MKNINWKEVEAACERMNSFRLAVGLAEIRSKRDERIADDVALIISALAAETERRVAAEKSVDELARQIREAA